MSRYTTLPKARNLLTKFNYLCGTVETYNAYTQTSHDFCGFADLIAFRPIMGCDILDQPLLMETVLHRRNLPYPSDDDHSISFEGCLAVQTTSASNVSAHVHKLTEGPVGESVKYWLACTSNRLEIWGWSKKGPKGKTKHWKPTIRRIVLDRDWDLWIYDDTELVNLGYEP